ncbi:Ribonuclease H-like domain, partial [Cinara cedri]
RIIFPDATNGNKKIGKKLLERNLVDNEKTDHFDLLLITEEKLQHYTYISNFSRLARSQKTLHNREVIFCKRCFTSFDHQKLKNKLSGQEALDQHKLICGELKLILPVIPVPGTTLKVEAWGKTSPHHIIIYADFEAILEDELLEELDIPTEPIIYRRTEDELDVAKHFVEQILELSLRVEKLLKTNKPIIMTAEDVQIADHNHLSGKFRQTLCNTCNLKLQVPKFILCFFHNLSNYNSHFIVTELGYDAQTISVIPNSEEKCISFSKRYALGDEEGCISIRVDRELGKVGRRPRKEDFYSTLTENNIDNDEYRHVKTVWDHFD